MGVARTPLPSWGPLKLGTESVLGVGARRLWDTEQMNSLMSEPKIPQAVNVISIIGILL